MEQSVTLKETRQWDPYAYTAGNKPQEEAALLILSESGISLTNKNVLDAGCGTGNISAIMAQTARNVHGIDASKEMIKFAQENFCRNNVSFQHAFIEQFKTKHLYDVATLFSCFHWIAKENQQQALQSLSDSLKPGGELLGMIITDPNQISFRLKVAFELFPRIQQILSFFKEKNIFDIIPSSHPTDHQFLTMLSTTDLEIISFKKKSIMSTFKSKNEIIAFEKALFSGVPGIAIIPNVIFNYFFDEYINKIMEKIQQNEAGEYTIPLYKIRILHARKKSN